MSKIEKVAKVIVGVELVGCAVASIWAYGKSQYYKGRISMADDMIKSLERDPDKVMDDIRRNKERKGKREA